ncbi:WhiB family transcriptional regulator [Blastococcus sp. TF02A-26]|uniref:WhiB family transcriptional regulator n=1 Tax=Blastococcus sp. TF02A-26 TaxID=2250577 RepID=UPI000DE80925|nr:hypothetical protein DQ240_18365 [Blastococcus sp. TF02A-26]
MTAPQYLDVPRFSAPALCAETDPDQFIPEKGGSVRDAKRLCGGCEARDECLDYALDHRLVQTWDGVWGGTTPRQRKQLLRERPALQPATSAPQPVERVVAPPAAAPALPVPAPVDPAPVALPTRIAPAAHAATTSGRRRWTDEELAAAVDACSRAGLTRRVEIAAALGVSVTAVRRVAAHVPDVAA